LVGIADDRRGYELNLMFMNNIYQIFCYLFSLDFDVRSDSRSGIFSSADNPLSFGFESNKRATVNGITHDDKNMRIRESHEDTFKVNPIKMFQWPFDKGVEVKNRKSTNLRVGDESIQKHNGVFYQS
jgi:hypothetical protein